MEVLKELLILSQTAGDLQERKHTKKKTENFVIILTVQGLVPVVLYPVFTRKDKDTNLLCRTSNFIGYNDFIG